MWMSVNGKPPDLGSGYEGSIPFIRTNAVLPFTASTKEWNKNGSLIRTPPVR